MKHLLILYIILIPIISVAQKTYPTEIEAVLKQAKNNRHELEKALKYFYKTGDSLKIKSINFLIVNMPIHKSYNYYWVDENGERVAYNELDYPTFKEAVTALDLLKAQKSKLHPVTFIYRDIDSIKANTLIENINFACDIWAKTPNKERVSENDFLEYILPYRTSVEPLQNWRKKYAERFSGLINSKEPLDTQIFKFGSSTKNWFTNTRGINEQKEPLPRLGALQLLSRQNSTCDDIAGLVTFMARSQGWAATVDFVPAWATASGAHFSNYINMPPSLKHHYDAVNGNFLDTLAREPSKVLRTTYSIQKETIAAILNDDTTQIPSGFLRGQNYIDVTNEYWETSNVETKLFTNSSNTTSLKNASVVYLSVWNYARWQPVWFAQTKASNKAAFTNMGKGAVYLPMYYKDKKLIPAGYPIINGYTYSQTLEPDTINTRTVSIKEQPKYLAFREGKRYNLFYWNNRWVSVGIKVPTATSTELIFDNVPSNALLLLTPEYTQRKERPFIITEKGEREWF